MDGEIERNFKYTKKDKYAYTYGMGMCTCMYVCVCMRMCRYQLCFFLLIF